jgi:endonuclease G
VKYFLIFLLATFVGVLTACGRGVVPLPGDESSSQSGDENLSLPAAGWAELPLMDQSDGVRYATHWVSADGMSVAGPETAGRVRNYTVAFSTRDRQSLWVAYPMHPWYDGEPVRSNTWRVDPLIPVDEQPGLRYSYVEVEGNGNFNRGHMLASDCRQRSRAMNNQTFHFTNSAPQMQNEFNAGIWLRLENLEKKWGFGDWAGGVDGLGFWVDTLYVVTGSTFVGGERRVTSDRNGNVIPVPTHFYKALLTTRGTGVGKPIGQCSADELRCVVFYIEHFGHAGGARPGQCHMMTVDDLEAIVGMDFFSMISPAARSVEASFDVDDWVGIDVGVEGGE